MSSFYSETVIRQGKIDLFAAIPMFVALSLGYIWTVGVVVITGVAWSWGQSFTESTALVTKRYTFYSEEVY